MISLVLGYYGATTTQIRNKQVSIIKKGTNMKNKQPKMGAEIIGRIPSLGVTRFIRNGSIVTRVSTSDGRRSNSLKQFVQR